MCGVAGIFDATGRLDRGQVETRLAAMNAAQRHRGPDDQTLLVTPHGGLAHTRLAIIDPANGRQPMCDESGATRIVFNGEIYNHRSLRSRLNGHTFRTNTDSESLVHLYEELGPGCVTLLDGMFAIAIFDAEGLFLARDPLGIKPLYYSVDGDGVTYFASEMQALAPYVSDVSEFPAGHWYHSQRGLHRYFDLDALAAEARSRPTSSESEAVARLRAVLGAAVEKRLMADVPLGVFLSGGLDSSIVSALAVKKAGRLHSFAIGTANGDDLPAARCAAEHLGTEHHERVVSELDVVGALPRVIERLESYDKALVRSAVANYLLAEFTAEHVKVALAGEGADELFAGYEYLRALPPGQVDRETLEITGNLHNSNLQRCDRMTMAHGLEARVPFLDVEMLRLAFSIPTSLKLRPNGDRPGEKWILRRAFEDILPEEIAWRRKQKFSSGSGAAETLARHAGEVVSDDDYEHAIRAGKPVDSKEELLYYLLFTELYSSESAISTVGRTHSPETN